MDIELITLVNSFRNTIALNNLLIKEKITRKLEMIHTMRYYGFPIMNYPPATGKRIIDELRRIDKEGDIMKYYNATNGPRTNQLLGDILHNAYQASGYDILLFNAPIHGTTIEGQYIQLDSEAIYDTLSRYAPAESVKSVCQIAADKYLIKMNTPANARVLCNLLNDKILERRVIKVEYIEPLQVSPDLDSPAAIESSQLGGNINDIDGDNINECNHTCKPNKKSMEIMQSQNNLGLGLGLAWAWFIDMMARFLARMKILAWK